MEFIENDKPVSKEQDEKSKNCKHDIISKMIEGSRWRFCRHCGMKAHADGRLDYICGFEYCRCMQ